MNENGIMVAMFHCAKWTLKKSGRLETTDSRADDGDLAEEILVTGLAFA